MSCETQDGGGYQQYRWATQRGVFFAQMNERVPWQALREVIYATSACPAARRCLSCAGCWRNTNWVSDCFSRSCMRYGIEACEWALAACSARP